MLYLVKTFLVLNKADQIVLVKKGFSFPAFFLLGFGLFAKIFGKSP